MTEFSPLTIPTATGGGSVHAMGINKGGSLKTTTTLNMGVMLQLLGGKPLIIDCAPEGHSSWTLGYLPWQIEYTVYDLLAGKCSLNDVILPTYYNPDPEVRAFFNPAERVDPEDPSSPPLLEALEGRVVRGPDLIPIKLSSEGDEALRGRKLRDLLLARVIPSLRAHYSYILCDTNPDLTNILTTNAIYAADYIVVPFVPEQLTVIGFKNLYDAIQEAQQTANSKLQIAGVLMAKVQDLKVYRDIIEPFRPILKAWDIPVFETVIKNNAHKFLSASNRRSVIVLDDPVSDGALEYWSFLAEYLALVGGPAREIVQQTVLGLKQERARADEEKAQRKKDKQGQSELTSPSRNRRKEAHGS